MGNSLKFTTKGFVKLSVGTSLLNDRIKFTIEDTGIGIK
jgi:hypothetical protein